MLPIVPLLMLCLAVIVAAELAKYKSVEGEIATVDVFVNLTTFGPDTTGPVKVPNGATKLVEIWTTVGAHGDTAGDNSTVCLRLSGDGVIDGPHDFVLAGVGSGVTSTSTPVNPSTRYPVDIGVKPNENINVAAVGTADFAVSSVGVTLVFA